MGLPKSVKVRQAGAHERCAFFCLEKDEHLCYTERGVFCGDGIGFFGKDGGIPRSNGINVAKTQE